MTQTSPTTARLLAGGSPNLAEHASRLGPLPSNDVDLAALIVASGLSGRGGAGFPTGQKLASTRRRPVVVGNAAEGEPISHKDAVLLTNEPHLVLDGLSIVAACLDASGVYLYLPARLIPVMKRALDERKRARWDRFNVTLTEAPDAFLSGEKSAAANRIEGKPALPRDDALSLSSRGVNRRPTFLSNVETFAHIALIARYGADWFRTQGTSDEPGTMLVTLTGAVTADQVVEVPLGTSLDHLLTEFGSIPTGEAQAVLVGGYHGSWIPGRAIPTVELSRASLHRFGASPGAGVVHVLGYDRCGLHVSAQILTYLAQQSAGQCGPCLNGLPRLAEVFETLARGHAAPGVERELERLASLVDGRGACRHPDGTARFMRSTLAVFAADIEAHRNGTCLSEPPQKARRHDQI